MKARDKKLAVLRQLSRETEALSLFELIEHLKLEFDFSTRSLRRWLNELANEGYVEKKGQKRGTKYKAVKKVEEKTLSPNSCFGTNSLDALKKVRQPIYERQPISYRTAWLDSYTPNVSYYLSDMIRHKLHNSGKRSSDHEPAGTYAHKIYNRLLIDLSYNSSRLEGNTYSLLDTERLLLQGASAEGKLEEEKIMILNHKEAIRYLIDNAHRLTINLETICTLHYLLAADLIEAKYAGKVRDHAVRIGGSTYVPFEGKAQLQAQLKSITNKAALIEDPFEQSFFLLVHISYLQAFADVNKRTARLSANIPLVISNLVPLSFNDVGREDYASAMIAVYELQDLNALVDLYAYSYLRTCAAYDLTVQAVGFDEIRARYRQQRRAILRQIIENRLYGDPMREFIDHQIKTQIPPQDQAECIEDILEDIEHLDHSRIVGLGIAPDQLQEWFDAQNSYS